MNLVFHQNWTFDLTLKYLGTVISLCKDHQFITHIFSLYWPVITLCIKTGIFQWIRTLTGNLILEQSIFWNRFLPLLPLDPPLHILREHWPVICFPPGGRSLVQTGYRSLSLFSLKGLVPPLLLESNQLHAWLKTKFLHQHDIESLQKQHPKWHWLIDNVQILIRKAFNEGELKSDNLDLQ